MATKTLIITGGHVGLGLHTVRALLTHPEWHIVLAGRSPERMQDALTTFKNDFPSASLSTLPVDLASLTTIKASIALFTAASLPPLHAIICNAGVSPMKNSTTSDGVDLTFGTNHLGHYYFVHLLTPHLHQPSRIIFISSGTHIPTHKLARSLGVPKPRYTSARLLAYPAEAPTDQQMSNPAQRYSTSKLCNVLAAQEFGRQFRAAGMERVGVLAIDPGLMPATELARDAPTWLVKGVFRPMCAVLGVVVDGIREVEVSGQHVARLVVDGELEGRSELYFDGAQESESSPDSYDMDKAKDLWNTSSDVCGLRDDETKLPVKI